VDPGTLGGGGSGTLGGLWSTGRALGYWPLSTQTTAAGDGDLSDSSLTVYYMPWCSLAGVIDGVSMSFTHIHTRLFH